MEQPTNVTFDAGTPAPVEPPKKKNTTLIIIIVVVVVLCCCCLAIAGVVASQWGNIMDLLSEMGFAAQTVLGLI